MRSCSKKECGPRRTAEWFAPADEQEQAVHCLPHLARDLLPDRPRVLSREHDALGDGIRVRVVPQDPFAHRRGAHRIEVLGEVLFVAEHRQHPAPGRFLVMVDTRLEQVVERDVDRARHVFRALDVARRPVQRFRDAAQHRFSCADPREPLNRRLARPAPSRFARTRRRPSLTRGPTCPCCPRLATN